MANTQYGWMDLVYVMTNAATNNQVHAYMRSGSDQLTYIGAYHTGGNGTGEQKVDPLSSQGSLIASPDGRFLYAVNAGSNDISSFSVSQNGELTLLGVIPSDGLRPNSLAMHGNYLYVSNAGNAKGMPSNITGFKIAADGRLARITGARYMLSTLDAQPACIVFSPDGTKLVVSELSTNQVSVYSVNMDGTLKAVTYNESNGMGPFGSMFLANGILIVTEAATNALTSYANSNCGMLRIISGSVPNGQSATCWVTATIDERFAYTSNAGSGTITQYSIGSNGDLTATANFASTPQMSGAPLDSSVSKDGENFYVLNGSQGSISMFRIQQDGRLTDLQVIENTGLPTIGAQGMAVL